MGGLLQDARFAIRAIRARPGLTQAAALSLGYGLWRERFAGDSGVVGQTLTLNGHPLTVIGVAPPGFGGTVVGLAFNLYFPLTLQSQLLGISPADPVTYGAIGLLLSGVAFLASWVPARRAARVDPMIALRTE